MPVRIEPLQHVYESLMLPHFPERVIITLWCKIPELDEWTEYKTGVNDGNILCCEASVPYPFPIRSISILSFTGTVCLS